MTLSDLIHKDVFSQSATATVATTATHEKNQVETVATVATVAVATPLDSLHELSSDDVKKIRTWLTKIGETDSVLIDEVINKCCQNIKARQYFLRRAEEFSQNFEKE